ncbi:transcription antitermination factor NusB [Azospirillum sp. TSO22-1]|uniref:RsmB/NOP family class I SAM-dependent RNA methyltransferase n=1 Tax=Azospirillum sp. TSO22-1 TaxID=716789 RepID=UPI000D621FE9|nr:transcription antitermination factor NusB [Azospirillum sp. TSO22-1]PWC54726.1 MFS transporter [Azospirillum sp. TSO22-1]
MTDATLAARVVALDLLRDVLRKTLPFDDSFDAHPKLKELEPRDRGFVRMLVSTMLRRLGQIDALIFGCLDKPGLPKAVVHDVLRLGAAQLVFLNTPAHAAVDTTVELAVAAGAPQYKGLINAVMRRLAREGAEAAGQQDAGRLNTPDWLWLSWRQAYGTARARAIVEAHLHEAPLDITVKTDPAAWAERLEATLLPTGSLRRAAGGSVTELPGFDEGAWWVQDLAASLPAKLIGDIAGKRVYDLCAAPGGKTAQLCAAGAEVTAVDRSAKRLERVRENLARLHLSAELVAADVATWDPGAPADAILLDAPCTATGAIRRHPDVQRLKTAEDVAKLSRAQGRLLAHAVDLLAVGGTLVYCTCSIQPEEGEAQIDRLIAKDPRVERVPVTADELDGLAEPINERGEVRSLPGMLPDKGGIDGFFVARLRRSS